MNRPIVIIGSGHAGYTLARAYRRLNQTRPVVIVTEDDGADYPKPQLSHGFGNGASAERLIRQSAAGIAAELKVMICAHTTVLGIDFDAQLVRLEQRSIPYGELVFAVGAQAYIPPMAGNALDQMLTLNTLQDYRRYREQLEHSRHVLVIGGGLIGTEVAHDIARHKRVSLVDVNDRLLSKLVPPIVSTQLQAELADVDFHFNTSVKAINRVDGHLRATLANGDILTVDTVVCAAGLRPRLELAQALDTRTGIVVDDHLRTSQAHVHALGDCAEIDGKVLPYLQPITLSANALAQTLAGTPTPVRFGPMPVAVKTPRYPIQLGGVTCGELEWEINEDETGLTAKATQQGEMVGYVTGGTHNGFRLLSQLPRGEVRRGI
ncbi:nitric oxide reductase FlRd-NAD(+) reductase [Jeongeupia sp. HS-3]|uniref:NADH:flavorubredoxin reductase NorW n=1 Tax=Jeongeupia sp. HS-3 TaxID=1009682 RepID=UPI0018A36F12|nr:NADH:flavorubredoxin reductase NorW [Jeongeupia sp. HS-3]BCL75585.1 nitric oxide reductase FlRd-NAD(+) reductase [Jeongeupia sp. HS-3]